MSARNLCKEFAPRDGAVRVSGEGGANRALEKPAGPGRRRGICVKNLLPGTELQGLAVSGEQTAPRNTRPSPEPALLPSGPDPNKKTPGGSPVFTPILLILLSLLFQRTQVDSLESFQVRFQQRKHFCDAPFVGGFHVQRKHRIVQGLP